MWYRESLSNARQEIDCACDAADQMGGPRTQSVLDHVDAAIADLKDCRRELKKEIEKGGR